MSPSDRWEKLEKDRMCYTCLTPKTICKGIKYTYVSSVPEVLKCTICASWAESKGLAPFSIFICKQKLHGESRAYLTDLWKKLEKYIGSTIVDSNIQFSVNFLFRKNKKNKRRVLHGKNSNLDASTLPPVPLFEYEMGESIPDKNLELHPDSSEQSIYLTQNLRIGWCNLFGEPGWSGSNLRWNNHFGFWKL